MVVEPSIKAYPSEVYCLLIYYFTRYQIAY